jgi:hypothetical protein
MTAADQAGALGVRPESVYAVTRGFRPDRKFRDGLRTLQAHESNPSLFHLASADLFQRRGENRDRHG